MLIRISRNIARIMVLQAGPQELPADAMLVNVALALYLVVNALTAIGPGSGVVLGAMESLLAAGILAAFVIILLRLRGWPERFAQTFSALLLTGTVFTMLAFGPMLKLLPYLRAGHQPPALLAIGAGALLVWRIAVMAHVFKQALEIRMGRAVALVILLNLIRWLLLMMLVLVGLMGSAA